MRGLYDPSVALLLRWWYTHILEIKQHCILLFKAPLTYFFIRFRTLHRALTTTQLLIWFFLHVLRNWDGQIHATLILFSVIFSISFDFKTNNSFMSIICIDESVEYYRYGKLIDLSPVFNKVVFRFPFNWGYKLKIYRVGFVLRFQILLFSKPTHHE
jgi:hypothetical protein